MFPARREHTDNTLKIDCPNPMDLADFPETQGRSADSVPDESNP
jgi:hypothetical protein